MTKICFLNPFGTDVYDSLIEETVTPSLRSGTELVIRHLVDYPANMDYFVPKHLAEVGVLRAVLAAERDGFDAFVIGCCYDPALTQARELTSMPVVGPLEASVMLARLFGHRFSVVTDHLQGGSRARGPGPGVRAREQLPLGVGDRLVHHRYGRRS